MDDFDILYFLVGMRVYIVAMSPINEIKMQNNYLSTVIHLVIKMFILSYPWFTKSLGSWLANATSGVHIPYTRNLLTITSWNDTCFSLQLLLFVSHNGYQSWYFRGLQTNRGPWCPWSYDSWIHYISNRCLSPLMLWVRISLRARCTTLCDKVNQWLVTGGFLRVLRFPPQIQLTTTKYLKQTVVVSSPSCCFSITGTYLAR